jgi:hypothetical protein
VQDIEDVGEQRGVRGLVRGSASSSPAEPVIANGRISRSGLCQGQRAFGRLVRPALTFRGRQDSTITGIR